MYIRRVVFEDVRGFQTLDFPFERPDGTYAGWNVVTGDNGSGKTAFLKGIALALVGPETARILQPELNGWVRQSAKHGTIAVQLVAGPQDRFASGRRYDKPFWSEVQLSRTSEGTVSLKPGQKYLRGKKGPTRGPWLEWPDGWFCVGYGPFRRLYGHSPEAQRIMSTRGKVSRFATLFREDATLAEGDLWLRDLRHRELEARPAAKETLNIVLQLLNHQFLQHGISVERVDSEGMWLRQPDGVILSLESMSDGFRAAIAMVVDIVRQLMEVHGTQGFDLSNSSEPVVAHSGLVLIDEVDAHLHPSWQRNFGDWFKRVLPKMQFIVTSHSPLICQAASERGLFHLPAPGSGQPPFQLSEADYEQVITGRPNEIYLSPAFGLAHTRSPRAVKAREEYARLQAKKRAVSLTSEEAMREKQLSLFAKAEVESEAP